MSAPVTHYPEQYLHVLECASGDTWIVPLRGNASLDLTKQVKKWVKTEFNDELRLSGKIQPRVEGEFYARIMTDSRPPDSGVCWAAGGFYLEDKP